MHCCCRMGSCWHVWRLAPCAAALGSALCTNGCAAASTRAAPALALTLHHPSPLNPARVARYVPIIAGSAVGRKGSSRGAVKARGNFQTFDTTAGWVGNQARFEVFGSKGRIDVDGTAVVVQVGV